MIYTHVLNYGPKGVRSPIDEPKAVSYTDQSKTPAFHNNTAQHKGGTVNEIMRFLYPKYRRNRLTAQHAECQWGQWGRVNGVRPSYFN